MNSKYYKVGILFDVLCISQIDKKLTLGNTYNAYEMTIINEDIIDSGIVYYKLIDDTGKMEWFSKRNLVHIYYK